MYECFPQFNIRIFLDDFDLLQGKYLSHRLGKLDLRLHTGRLGIVNCEIVGGRLFQLNWDYWLDDILAQRHLRALLKRV